jgi:5-hydroxyisourate hydrolase
MAGQAGSILSTHVLNNVEGIAAAGVTIEVHRVSPAPALLARIVTDADGRSPTPLLPAAGFQPGRYELRFHVGDYFAARGLGPEPRYLDVVVVNVGLHDATAHYHVPLGCTPWAYNTYRGS